jgi:hypothetical protein
MTDKDLHYVSDAGRNGLIVIALIGLIALAAWCFTHERIRDISEGRAVDSGLSRCVLYRRCCRPRCRFVEVEGGRSNE